MAAVQMKHMFFRGDRTLYFYFGEAKVRDGIAYIPHDRVDWVSRSYILGYRLDPETGEEVRMEHFKNKNIAIENRDYSGDRGIPVAAATDSAKSAKETKRAGSAHR